MDSPITVGIVGHGLIGRTHAKAIHDVEGALLTAVVSRRNREEHTGGGEPDLAGITTYESIDAICADKVPDVVAVCSPSAMHGPHARTALENGAHVLVEKPPAGSVAELRDLAALAKSNDLHLAVVSQQRLEPHMQHVAGVLRTGGLGAALLGEVRLHWHRPQSYYDEVPWRKSDPHGGSLANQGWHAVDLLTWFLGQAAHATAQTATLGHRIGVEDTTVATVAFRRGGLGTIVTSTATPPGEPAEVRLFFEKGSIGIRDAQISEWIVPDEIPDPPAVGTTGSGASDPAAIGAIGHRRQWQDLVDAIRTGARPAVTAADSAPTLELIEAIYRSSDTGGGTVPREDRS